MNMKLKKNQIAKFSSVGDDSGLLSTKILLAVVSIVFFILLVVSFDDLSYRQENIRSKFKAELS